jgi:hypothetical protein
VQQSERDHWEPQPFTRAAAPSKRSGSHCSPSGGSLRASAALLHASAISRLICITTASMLRRTIMSRLRRADMPEQMRQRGARTRQWRLAAVARITSTSLPVSMPRRAGKVLTPSQNAPPRRDRQRSHASRHHDRRQQGGRHRTLREASPITVATRQRQRAPSPRPTTQRRTRQRHHDASLWARVV